MKKGNKKSNLNKLACFIMELRNLKHIPRAGIVFLKGPTKETVAEHCFYTTMIGWILAKLEKANENRIIKMCLTHDIVEGRIGDENLINKFYSCPVNEPKVLKEILTDSGLNHSDIENLFEEFFEGKTKDAQISKDADILSQMIWEKECLDLGNKKAEKWVNFSLSRLKTKNGKALGKNIKDLDCDEWWVDLVRRYILKTKFL
jgi:5'-deoxynucleotidase YfbR-like HD superfamily hydrolase